jgi:signal transduction histidine kinase
MKTEYINEVRMRKHDMRPYLTNLGSIGRMMQAYISKLEGMPEIQNKLSSLVVEHKKALESLSNLVSVLSEEQTFGTAEEVDINKFIRDLEKSNDSKVSGFKLNYHVDRNAVYESAIFSEEDANDNIPLYVNIAKIDFERLVSNILENARTHGFAGREDNNGVVRIFVTVNLETDSFQIDFVNNGNPLPEGMNKMRFGLRGEKAGKTGRTGNGGYIIKSIVEHYKGDYDVFMDGDDTVIRVLLPILRESYE